MSDIIEEAIYFELAWLNRMIKIRHGTRTDGKNSNLWYPSDKNISKEFNMYHGPEQIETKFNLRAEINKQLIKLYNMGWIGYGKY